MSEKPIRYSPGTPGSMALDDDGQWVRFDALPCQSAGEHVDTVAPGSIGEYKLRTEAAEKLAAETSESLAAELARVAKLQVAEDELRAELQSWQELAEATKLDVEGLQAKVGELAVENEQLWRDKSRAYEKLHWASEWPTWLDAEALDIPPVETADRLRGLGYEDVRPEGGCADALGMSRPAEIAAKPSRPPQGCKTTVFPPRTADIYRPGSPDYNPAQDSEVCALTGSLECQRVWGECEDCRERHGGKAQDSGEDDLAACYRFATGVNPPVEDEGDALESGPDELQRAKDHYFESNQTAEGNYKILHDVIRHLMSEQNKWREMRERIEFVVQQAMSAHEAIVAIEDSLASLPSPKAGSGDPELPAPRRTRGGTCAECHRPYEGVGWANGAGPRVYCSEACVKKADSE